MAASAQGLPDGTLPNVAGHVSGLGPGGHPVGEPGGSAEIQTPPLHAETVSQEASDLPLYSQTSPSSLHAEPRTGAVVGHTALHASRAASWPRWVDASDPASDASLARFAGIPESSDASPSSGSNSPDAAPQPTRDATLAHTTAVSGRAFTAVEHTARRHAPSPCCVRHRPRTARPSLRTARERLPAARGARQTVGRDE